LIRTGSVSWPQEPGFEELFCSTPHADVDSHPAVINGTPPILLVTFDPE